MSDQPMSIHIDRVRELYTALGLDPAAFNHVFRITIDPHAIVVERYRRNTEGRMVLAGDRPATETVDIAIDRSNAQEQP